MVFENLNKKQTKQNNQTKKPVHIRWVRNARIAIIEEKAITILKK